MARRLRLCGFISGLTGRLLAACSFHVAHRQLSGEYPALFSRRSSVNPGGRSPMSSTKFNRGCSLIHELQFVCFFVDAGRRFVHYVGMANELKSEAKAQVVSLLCEGNSIISN